MKASSFIQVFPLIYHLYVYYLSLDMDLNCNFGCLAVAHFVINQVFLILFYLFIYLLNHPLWLFYLSSLRGASILPPCPADVRAASSVSSRSINSDYWRYLRGGGAVKVSQRRKSLFFFNLRRKKKNFKISKVSIQRNIARCWYGMTPSLQELQKTRWQPAFWSGSVSPLCSACAAVFWRKGKVCQGTITTCTWLDCNGKRAFAFPLFSLCPTFT